MSDRKITGNSGEQFAVALLYQQGYDILETNYRCRFGEVDIVCRKGSCIFFVEVKTREADDFFRPCHAVNGNKKKKIRMVAARYLQEKRIKDYNITFLVFEIGYNMIFDDFEGRYPW